MTSTPGGGVCAGPPQNQDPEFDDHEPFPRLFDGGVANEHKGIALAGAGFVDGDGLADTIVGAGAGWATINCFFFGNTVVYSSQPGSGLGFSVASAGDVDGDGFDDVILGEPFFDAAGTDDGRAHVHRGALSAIGTNVAAWTLASP